MIAIQHVLFDLDDTLYTDASGLFSEVGLRIVQWTQHALNVGEAEANALRQHYFTTFGTTMSGLLHEHPDVDIDDYLDYVHDIDITRYLDPNPELNEMLSRLSAPKSVFTNSIASWAERITRHLGIRSHFEHIFDVRASGYRSKPDPHSFNFVLKTLNLPAAACILLDDRVSYLKGAAAAGIHTVLVRTGGQHTDGIEFVVDHILDAEPILQQLLSTD
jgi:putative hydrolase of the HAD superfamily